MRKILCSNHYPYSTKHKNKHNKAVIGIGGNIGNCIGRFENLFFYLSKNKNIKILSSSPIYLNPAFGFEEQSEFYNATIELDTKLNIIDFFSLVFYIERRFGRQRKRLFKNAPRTLDIDIIFFNNLKIKRPYLHIPHPQFQNRDSVLIPMSFHLL